MQIPARYAVEIKSPPEIIIRAIEEKRPLMIGLSVA